MKYEFLLPCVPNIIFHFTQVPKYGQQLSMFVASALVMVFILIVVSVLV